MKKLSILSILLLFFSSLSYAQSYEPIIKEGSFWDIQEIGSGACNIVVRTQIDGEITINGKVYKTLKRANLKNSDNTTSCLISPIHVDPNDFTSIENVYLREDVNDKKLYIYTNSITGNFEEYVVCDFNLEVGDQLLNYFGHITDPLTLDSITVNTENRKVYHLSDGSSYIEGIGKTNGNLKDYYTTLDGITYSIYCWGNNQNQNGCAPVLSIEDYQLSQINVFPNPTSDKISLTNLENNSFKLFSILGNEISFQFSKENQEIDLSHLNQGIYFLKIQGGNGAKRIVKIIRN